MTNIMTWSAPACATPATAALATITSQGIAVRSGATKALFAAFGAVEVPATAAKRTRAFGAVRKAHTASDWGSSAWSPRS